MNLVQGGRADHSKLLLLAPTSAIIPETFARVECNPAFHADALAGLQMLRGKSYLEDGAIHRSEMEADGRFVQSVDADSWHLVSLNERGAVTGCARYLAHPANVAFSGIMASTSALSRSAEWASPFREAVESEIELSRRLGVDYVEVGGWALAPELRCTTEALRIALGMFSMARLLGGCIGLTTATRRHCSASILHRIGGHSLVANGTEIPAYYDARYDCEMEILRFNSARPNPRFEPWVEELKRHLSAVPVIVPNVLAEVWRQQPANHQCAAMTAA